VEVFGFTHHAEVGSVEVDVGANTEPLSFGVRDDGQRFPACKAKVRYAGGGYHAMFGWIQLVRSTDAAAVEFEMDPFVLFPDIDSPYCFYGYKPTLFDAPGRSHREDMDWVAHSFLGATPIEHGAREVLPLQGFSWGFSIRNGVIQLASARPLTPSEWINHIPYLRAAYPNWQFTPVSGWT
jgi:hypothetical protein